MNNSIELLQTIVTTVGKFTEATGNHFKEGLQVDLLSGAQRETGNIKTFLLREPQDLKNREALTVVVHHYQLEILHMVDKLYACTLNGKANTAWLVKPIINELNALLLHLKEHYIPYFNPRDKLSDSYREEVVAAGIDKQLERLKECQLKNADIELVEIIGKCIKPGKTFSYNDQEYAEKLLSGLEQLREGANTDDLVLKLVEFNFNCGGFISYLVNRLSEGVAGEDSLQEKKHYFYNQRKNIRQVFSDAGVAFMTANEPVKEKVCKWIEEEIEHLEKREQRAKEIDSLEDDGGSFAELSGGGKVPINLSAEVIAVLLRLFWEMGLVPVKSLSFLYRIFCQSFRTLKMGELSDKSLRAKGYAPSKATKDFITDLLLRMIRLLRDY